VEVDESYFGARRIKGKRGRVAYGKTILLKYTLTLEDKKVLDTNVGGEPQNFTQSSHHIIPGLETTLEGMKVGESKQVTVDPEQRYGPGSPQAVQEVPINQIPPDARKVGVRPKQGRFLGLSYNF